MRTTLSPPSQKFANVFENRLLTRAAPFRAATVRESPMALRATKPDEAANCRSNGINDLGGVFRGVADGPTGHRR